MSRRSRIATVVRVAEIRETVARAEVAAATRARDEAQRDLAARQQDLSAVTVSGGTTADLLASVRRTGLRADAVAAAFASVTHNESARAGALTAWSVAAQRSSLLHDLAARQREQAAGAAERATQKLLDDLAAARAGEGTA